MNEKIEKEILTEVEEDKNNDAWICPICQGIEYERSDRVIKKGAEFVPEYYECEQCTIHFGDPKNFNFITLNEDVIDAEIKKALKDGCKID